MAIHESRLRRLRALLARGTTLRRAAAELGVPKSTLHLLAARHRMPRRRRGLPADKDRQIAALARRGALSVRRIAREAGVHRDTVTRVLIERLRHFVGAAPYRRCQPWRCPCGLRLEIRRCLRCGATKPRKRKEEG